MKINVFTSSYLVKLINKVPFRLENQLVNHFVDVFIVILLDRRKLEIKFLRRDFLCGGLGSYLEK